MPAKSPGLTTALEKRLRELGQLIRERRKALGVTAVSAAESAHMSRITLNRIEQGEPSVAMGAYLNVIETLGLHIELIDPQIQKLAAKNNIKLPSKIKIEDFKQLKKLAWQFKKNQTLAPQEVLDLYERNWRHIDIKSLDAKEKELIQNLLAAFNRERLLV